MNSEIKPDPAAIFAVAFSLWEACNRRAKLDHRLYLSDAYSGYDQLMREVMRIGETFESWACENVEFNESSEVWPYFLGDQFGETCLKILHPTDLAQFDSKHCLRVALKLRIPIKAIENLPVPIDIFATNPNPTAAFKSFRIQTVRESLEDEQISPFVIDDDPFDPEYNQPVFGIYGIGPDELLEHIADFETYTEAANLLRKMIPAIELPETAISPHRAVEQKSSHNSHTSQKSHNSHWSHTGRIPSRESPGQPQLETPLKET